MTATKLLSRARLFHWQQDVDGLTVLQAAAYPGPPVLVTHHESITIHFDYPLQRPVTFTFESAGGFTLVDLFRCIHEGYTRIYTSEPLSYCPGESKGPYGI